MIDDRNVMNTIFNAMGALAKRLTGEMMIVCVQNEKGEWCHFYPQLEHVHWINLEEAGRLVGLGGALAAMRCPLHSSPNAIVSEDPRVLG